MNDSERKFKLIGGMYDEMLELEDLYMYESGIKHHREIGWLCNQLAAMLFWQLPL